MDLQLLGSASGEFYGDANDISYDGQGNAIELEGADLTRQRVVKALLTELNAANFFAGYGSTLSTLIQSRSSPGEIENKIRDTVVYAVTYINETVAATRDDEILDEIQFLDVEFRGADTVLISIGLLLADGTPLRVTLGA